MSSKNQKSNRNKTSKRKSQILQDEQNEKLLPSSPLNQAKISTSSGSEPVVNEKERKKQSFITRAIWTIVMITGFFIILFAGPIWCILLILVLQTLVFKEVTNLVTHPARKRELPLTRFLNWYFFVTAIYYLDGIHLKPSFLNKFFLTLVTHHRFNCYCMYIMGFVMFVSSLKKGHYKFQFAQFCTTHMTIIFVVFQAHAMISNVFNGIFWFFIPASLVISNDIFAYLCGITMGRTQLISISPKKTVEGFIGGWICTMIAAFFLSAVLARFNYLICPMNEDNIFFQSVYSSVDCVPNPAFTPQEFFLPEFASFITDKKSVIIAPVHLHVVLLGTFASLIAPFGGFFASGLKRAFKVKDFGDTIPGHGGITDRMDCQFIMGSFAYLYYETFVAVNKHMSVSNVLQLAILNLTVEDQINLMKRLNNYLVNQELITGNLTDCLTMND